jgi:hypothetical protein
LRTKVFSFTNSLSCLPVVPFLARAAITAVESSAICETQIVGAEVQITSTRAAGRIQDYIVLHERDSAQRFEADRYSFSFLVLYRAKKKSIEEGSKDASWRIKK